VADTQSRPAVLREVQSLCSTARDSAGPLVDAIGNNRVALLLFETLTGVQNAAQSELSGHESIQDPMELADALLDHLRRNLDSAFSRANRENPPLDRARDTAVQLRRLHRRARTQGTGVQFLDVVAMADELASDLAHDLWLGRQPVDGYDVAWQRIWLDALAAATKLISIGGEDDRVFASNSAPGLGRQESLSSAEASQYAGAFEAAFQAIAEANQDGLIPAEVEEDVLNLMRQFELAWHRSSVKTQQLELLVVELLEVLNGAVEDEPKFRTEFEELGADPELAAVLAHRLAMGIVDARQHLGVDDPVEAAASVERVSENADAITSAEQSLFGKASEAAAKGAGTAIGAGGVAGAVAYRDVFFRMARAFVVGISRLLQHFYGG
jgi:hypothetical protein